MKHKDEKPVKTIVPNGKREGHTQKDEKPMKTIEESIGTRMSNECNTQKPVNTIVFRVRAEQGCHEYKYLDQAHKDQKPVTQITT